MRTFLLLMVAIASALAQRHPLVIDRGDRCAKREPCSFSTNFPWDTSGYPDTRPLTWGTTDSTSLPIQFVHVPPGSLVRILRAYGDLIAWPHGPVKPGTFSGILAGLTNSTADQSPFVSPGLGSKGCFLYVQGQMGSYGTRIPIDISKIAGGLLNEDHTLNIDQAIYLNETGASLHLETTLVIDFAYEPKGQR